MGSTSYWANNMISTSTQRICLMVLIVINAMNNSLNMNNFVTIAVNHIYGWVMGLGLKTSVYRIDLDIVKITEIL